MNTKLQKQLKFTAVCCILVLTLGACDNYASRHWGGTMSVEVPDGNKLVNATWKEGQLWYLYTPRNANEQPKTSVFQEKSMYGVLQGKVIFTEK